MAEQLGDRIKHLFTINEFASFVEGGYQGADVQVRRRQDDPGGIRAGPAALRFRAEPGPPPRRPRARPGRPGHPRPRPRRHQGRLRRQRARGRPGHRHPRPRPSRRDRHPGGQRRLHHRHAGGRYTDAYLASADAPEFTEDELGTIGSPLDFVGINGYKPAWYVAPSGQPPGDREIPISASIPRWRRPGMSLIPRSCTGHHARCSRSGVPRRSSSPRTAAPQRTWSPPTARCTTPTG
jgi:beta-glucosidase